MAAIYLDNNSTTRPAQPVLKAIQEAWSKHPFNPASQHNLGQESRRLLDQCRTQILKSVGAEVVGMEADRCIFTSGGTEANNLAMFGLPTKDKTTLVSPVEHPSISQAAAFLWSTNNDVRYLKVDTHGVVCLEDLEEKLKTSSVGLVSIMLANNETGVCQPIKQIARLAHHYGAKVHCDAVQAVGKIPVDFASLNVDSLSISCHKFHGPVGIGALVLKKKLPLRPMLFGGHQQEGFRPGTENLPLAEGFRVATELFLEDLDARTERMAKLRDRLESGILDKVSGVEVNGSAATRLPHTSNLSFCGIDRQAFLMAADFNDLCLSTGSACSSGSSEPSPVLLAMGCEKKVVDSAIRFSLSSMTTELEIDLAIEKVVQICRNLSAAK